MTAVARLCRALRAPTFRMLLLVLPWLLAACHHSNITVAGTPTITMGSGVGTPDPDFASYIVNIDSMTLTRDDGVIVEPLSAIETVDLNRLNNMSELVAAPAVPSGTYTTATFTIDYSYGNVWVNNNGTPVIATMYGTDDAVITAETITINFDSKNPLVIPPGQSMRLNIDADVNAMNTIDDFATGKVTVQPFVVLSAAPVDSTPMRARGLFVTAQPDSSNYIVNMRPFYDLVSALGALTVNTTPATYFSINGITYVGQDGLAALNSQLPAEATVSAVGTLDSLAGITPSFTATEVYGGTSTQSDLYEYVTGTVSGRTGDTVYLRGVTYSTPLEVVTFYADVPVTVGSQTVVNEDGVAATGLSAQSISIGQQVTVAGLGSIDTTTNALTMDATEGLVRLAPTQLWGTLNSATTDSISLDMLTLDNYPRAAFNFNEVGGAPADPSNYTVNTGKLNESAVAAGTLMQVQGIVSPYDAAPPNFQASSVTTAASAEQMLVIDWTGEGSATPFTSITAAGLVVNLSDANIGAIHQIRIGPSELLDLKSLPKSPLITTVGANASELQLAIGNPLAIYVFNGNDDFIDRVYSSFHADADKIFRLTAYGQFNAATNTFVATRIHVVLQTPPTT
jgi:hypothetical protein